MKRTALGPKLLRMNDTFDVEVYFDGECPLCMREIRMLQRFDKGARIRFTDIAARDFEPATTGLSMATLMDRIHGRLPNGERIEGVEVFRRLYRAVGFGWLLAWTAWPGFRTIADAAYRVFAKNRLRFTGRCVPGDDGVCALPVK